MRRSRFAEHYNRYFSLVCGILYARVRDVHVAEDLAQEIFIDLYRKYDTIEKVHAWLLAAVRIKMFEHRRRAGRLPDYLGDRDGDDGLPAHTDPPLEMKMIIGDAIDSITGFIDRVVFDLVSIQHYTYVDAAAALGLTRRQVRYRHGLAVRQVLRALASMGVTSTEDLQ